MNQTNNTAISAREIKEGMTQGQWEFYLGGESFIRNGIEVQTEHGGESVCVISDSEFEGMKNDFDIHAACTAVNGTFGKNLDPTKYEEVVMALERILDRIKENDLQHMFPSAFERATKTLSTARINSL